MQPAPAAPAAPEVDAGNNSRDPSEEEPEDCVERVDKSEPAHEERDSDDEEQNHDDGSADVERT